MQRQHEQDIADLTDSLAHVGQRVDSLATDVTNQMHNLTSMLHTLMLHVGITPQLEFQQTGSQPERPSASISEPAVIEFGSRQLHRQGTGSRSPRRDGEETALDGIPDLPLNFSFDTPGA